MAGDWTADRRPRPESALKGWCQGWYHSTSARQRIASQRLRAQNNRVEFGARAAIFKTMRRSLTWFPLICLLAATVSAEAATGHVLKVLPHFLDLQGRHALSPSLYDRDAYQARLRQHPDQRSGVRFDVQWKAKQTGGAALKLRAELRGIAHGNLPRQKVLEQEVKAGVFSKWTALLLGGADYKDFGEVTAWRVTLWDGDQLLGAQQSFLW